MHSKNLNSIVAASFAEHREEKQEEDMDVNDNDSENEGEESSLKMWKKLS